MSNVDIALRSLSAILELTVRWSAAIQQARAEGRDLTNAEMNDLRDERKRVIEEAFGPRD